MKSRWTTWSLGLGVAFIASTGVAGEAKAYPKK